MTDFLVVAALAAASVTAGLRWLRIAQREHYLPGAASRFARRWWLSDPVSAGLVSVGVLGLAATWWWTPAGLVVAAVVAIGPLNLSVRGRTSPLRWTNRLRRLSVLALVAVAAAATAGVLGSPGVTALAALGLPLLIDGAAALAGPLERRLGRGWVEKAAATLRSSGATVVAITGSFGKTSTKGHVAHLVGGARRTLASPASFNNRMGLARTVNEQLSAGTEVFVAEMGTYGPGEIRDLCSWIPPDIAVITAIGPVHLERFGSEERILEAKSEILAGARVAVLNVDDSRLDELASRESSRREVIRVGTRSGLDVAVMEGTVSVAGEEIGGVDPDIHASNVACAVGVVVALGIDPHRVAERLGGLTEPEHRRTLSRAASGVVVVDDTFNSNPAGAAAALATLAGLDVAGRRVVVTPGMVELGDRQHDENIRWAASVAAVADILVVVGRTNRSALTAGAGEDLDLVVVEDRDEAVAWVRSHLAEGDAVLYENDLPDHYP